MGCYTRPCHQHRLLLHQAQPPAQTVATPGPGHQHRLLLHQAQPPAQAATPGLATSGTPPTSPGARPRPPARAAAARSAPAQRAGRSPWAPAAVRPPQCAPSGGTSGHVGASPGEPLRIPARAPAGGAARESPLCLAGSRQGRQRPPRRSRLRPPRMLCTLCFCSHRSPLPRAGMAVRPPQLKLRLWSSRRRCCCCRPHFSSHCRCDPCPHDCCCGRQCRSRHHFRR
eukprot:365482-Chlamydomonas_euryale.AAC.13